MHTQCPPGFSNTVVCDHNRAQVSPRFSKVHFTALLPLAEIHKEFLLLGKKVKVKTRSAFALHKLSQRQVQPRRDGHLLPRGPHSASQNPASRSQHPASRVGSSL